jgi:hypothetical protein
MIRGLLILNFVLVVALGVLFFWKPSGGKMVFVLNNEVFAGFKGKLVLEEKLKTVRAENKRTLDSLILIVQGSNKPEVTQYYRDTEENFRITEQHLSEQYTADIWKRINTYMIEFGKEHNYTFVLGATGNGNLMYASEALNVTPDAIEFINKKYEAEE